MSGGVFSGDSEDIEERDSFAFGGEFPPETSPGGTLS